MQLARNSKLTLENAIFTISIDLELIWGTLDLPNARAFRRLCEIERNQLFDRLLGMLSEYRIGATWGVVGHLFLESCNHSPLKHPEIVPPQYTGRWKPWFHDDPGANEHDEPLFYGSELIAKLRDCPVPQEIGSHTFSHVIMGAEGCSEATAESELRECVRVAQAAGLELRSLIFPRNSIGYLEVARRLGFTCYRGPEPHWYEAYSKPIRRFGHLLEIAGVKTPPAVMPEFREGLWNIPGSMLYTPSFGPRCVVPVWTRVLRAKRGLRAAVRQKRIFHLWFHPTDLVRRMDAMLGGLRSIFEEAARLRDSGQLEILPMHAVAAAKPVQPALEGAVPATWI